MDERKRKDNLQRQNVWVPLGVAGLLTASTIGISVFAQTAGAPGATPSPTGTATASPTSSPTSQPGQQSQREVYEAQLAPANSSGASGTARVVVEGNNVGISIQATGLAPGVAHLQHIHSGTSCADPSADRNGDGFIDAAEGSAVAGTPVLPLTLNLLQQAGTAGGNPADANSLANYPVASTNGSLDYISAFTLSSLPSVPPPAAPTTQQSPGASPTATQSLGATPTQSPGIAGAPSASPPGNSGGTSDTGGPTGTEPQGGTLSPIGPGSAGTTPTPTGSPTAGAAGGGGGTFPLAGRVVEIHGVANAQLPATVESIEGLPAQNTLPVACGVLQRTQ